MKKARGFRKLVLTKKNNISGQLMQHKEKIVDVVFKVTLMLFCGFGIIFASKYYDVWAKYVVNDSSEEVVNANSFYFTSNYLNPIGADNSVSEYILFGWDGKSKKSFPFNIRNYDNPLLYNNESQDVEYEISYEILNGDEEYVDAKVYRIENGSETETLGGILLGGSDSYTAHEYKLSITSKDALETIDHDVTILLTAKTKNAPYYAELQTKITLQYTSFKNFIAHQGFSTEENNESVKALRFDINTANQIDESEMENTDITIATETIHLSWNNALVELNGFDKKITDRLASKKLADVLNEYEKVYQCKNTIIIDETTNVGHIYFDALAYSAYEVIFYKRENTEGNESIWKNAEGDYLWDLEPVNVSEGGLVYAEKVDK